MSSVKALSWYSEPTMPVRKNKKSATKRLAAEKTAKVRNTANPGTFRQIEVVSLKDQVFNAMKDAFLEGQLKPGAPIVERYLADQMKVGTPVVREALIALEGQGFVRRVKNTGTYVTEFSPEEVRQLYALRVELEALALQWARTRVTEKDLKDLERMVDEIVQAGESGKKRLFLERDYQFHRQMWLLSGNTFLAETLDRLMAPLFVFVVVASGAPLTASMGREHYELVNALRSLQEPEFSTVTRRTLYGFAMRWLTTMAKTEGKPDVQAGGVA
jgi:DNA-binding GntR family transcriptional regulator